MIEAAHSFGDPKDLTGFLIGEQKILESIDQSLLDRANMMPENVEELEQERSRSIGHIALYKDRLRNTIAA